MKPFPALRATSPEKGEVCLPPQVAAPLERSWTESEAFDFCRRLTQSHYENFPVGSSLIPKELRPAIHSLYAFMRTADDFSDEDRKAGDEAERLTWLESWESMLEACEKGEAKHPIFIALRSTLQKHGLPVQWLRDLLHAFKMDVTVRRYATYPDLLAYCRYSANPVGRLILTLFGYRDEELYRLSDSICTGLQLANHWQDVAVDLAKDRIYVPQEDMRQFGVTDGGLKLLLPSREKAGMRDGVLPLTAEDHPSPQSSPLKGEEGEAFRRLLGFEVARARTLFADGRPLPERVRGRLRWELRFTWQGGVRILDKIENAQYDVFHHRPVVTKMDWVGIALRSLI